MDVTDQPRRRKKDSHQTDLAGTMPPHQNAQAAVACSRTRCRAVGWTADRGSLGTSCRCERGALARCCDDRIGSPSGGRLERAAGAVAVLPLTLLGLLRVGVRRWRTSSARAWLDGGDDLFGVDALQVDADRAEVRVAELALDHVERHALASELDGVGVAQLVRRNTGVLITQFLVGGIGSTRWTPLQIDRFSHGCPLNVPRT
jgi:hypothetical protein